MDYQKGKYSTPGSNIMRQRTQHHNKRPKKFRLMSYSKTKALKAPRSFLVQGFCRLVHVIHELTGLFIEFFNLGSVRRAAC